MKNEKLFSETIDILVKAYMNGTLIHGNCSACAVGNIVASRCDYKFQKTRQGVFWQHYVSMWNNVFITSFGSQKVYPGYYRGEAKEQIDSTGYTWQELAVIEKAFEFQNYHGSDADGYKGLMAVVDVLCEIHECEEVKEETKALFIK